MLRSLTILTISLIITIFGHAQTIVISGVIRDATGTGLAKATVELIKPEDTLRVISMQDGSFLFQTGKGTHFELKITMKGYKSIGRILALEPGKNSIIIPPIILENEYQELVPVLIAGSKPINILEDTIEYHASAYRLRPGAELERLMKRLPGVDWDTGGNISIEGKILKRVKIDGQDYTGGDIKTALKNLPVDIIDKVQVIDDYGDKARLTGIKIGEYDKVLNIVIKKDKHNGGLANIEVGSGNANKYTGSLYSQLFSGSRQLSFNGYLRNISDVGNLYERLSSVGYADKWGAKWLVNGGMDVWGDSHSIESKTNQNSYFLNSRDEQLQNSKTSGSNSNALFSYTLTYVPNENVKLRIGSYAGSYKNDESISANFINLSQDSGFAKSAAGSSLNLSSQKKISSGSDLYFEKLNLKSKSRFSIQAFYRFNGINTFENNLNRAQIEENGITSLSRQHYLINLENNSKDLSAKFSYYIPGGKTSFIELTYSWQYSNTQSTNLTKSVDSISAVPAKIDSLSNSYAFRVMTSRFHAGYLAHFGKLSINVGLDALPSYQFGRTAVKESEQVYHYFSWLPATQISYNISSSKKMILEYKTSTKTPSMEQLTPILNISNPQNPIQGNPDLRNSYLQSVMARYEFSSLKSAYYRGVQIGLTYATTDNLIVPNSIYIHDFGAVVKKTSYVNTNGSHSVGASYQIHFAPFCPKYVSAQLSGNINAANSPVVTDGVESAVSSTSWNQNISFNLNLPNILESSVAGYYGQTYTGKQLLSSPTSVSYFQWLFSNRYEFIQNWVFNSALSESYFSGVNGRLITNPMQLNASLQYELLSKIHGKIGFSAYNLFAANSGVTQSTTPTNITQNITTQVGRHYLVTMAIKLQRFKKKIR